MGEQVIDYYAKKATYESESEEILRTQKMYDYLKNDSAAIKYHLKNYLSKIVNTKTLANMPLIWLNEVPRIISRRCLVYKKQATRKLDNETLNEKYSGYTKYKNKFAKEFHKQGKLFNTILVRPLWDKTKQQLDYIIIARNISDVEIADDDSLKMVELKYQINYFEGDEEKTAVIHWTNEETWATEIETNKEITNKLSWMPEDKKNPYGRIPFEILRFEDCADFWGDGMPDLVEGQEALNARLTDAFFKLYMSFGQPVGTNLGIKKDEFSIGYDKPILRDNVRNDNTEAPPNLEFITPEHRIDLDKEVNDWFKNQLANTKGLPSNGIRYTSGYEREVDNIELIDLNIDDQDILRDFEERLFDLEKIVLRVDAKIELGDAKISINFAKVEMPETETDKWTRRDKEYNYNMSTPIDWLIEEQGLTKEQAQEKLTKNKTDVETILPKPKSKLQDLLTQ